MTTISKQPWEAKKDEIIQQMLLLDATQLAEVCGTASVIIPPAKVGDRSRIYNLLLTHLISDDVAESEDHGLALFAAIEDRIKAMSVQVKGEDKTMVTAEVTDVGGV